MGKLAHLHKIVDLAPTSQMIDSLRPLGFNVIIGHDGDLPGSFETLNGTSGNDAIFGLGGGDVLDGGAGNDILAGGAGDDFIISDSGGIGNDFILGGSGIDTIDYLNSAATSGIRLDLQRTGAQNTGGAGIDVVVDIENVWGTNFNDRISGSAANNFILAGAGNDVIDGRGGNDSLSGGAGNDVLRGGTGDDDLTGGAGKDILTGGAGADSFNFITTTDSNAANQDVITDYNHAQGDIMFLDFLSFHEAVDFTRFLGSGQFTGDPFAAATVVPEIRAENQGGDKWLIQVDTNSDLQADFQVTVHSAADISFGDFIF